MGFVPVKPNGTTSFTNCFMDPIGIRETLLDLRAIRILIGSARCTMVKSDNLVALQSIYIDKLAQKRCRPNTNMWLWLAEFVTNLFWIRSISWLTRAPTRQGSRSERPHPTKHRGLIFMCKCGKSYSWQPSFNRHRKTCFAFETTGCDWNVGKLWNFR